MSDYSSTVSRPISPVADPPQTARPYRFHWVSASVRRPGPGSVSETTEGGQGDFFTTRSPAELLESPLPLGALPPDWSSSKHGFNAISTVLNNPHKLQAPPKAHSALPTVVVAELPRVRRKDFDPYLQSLALEWPRFESNLRTGRAGFELDEYHGGTSRSDSSQTPAKDGAGRPLPPLDSVPSVFFTPKFNLGDQTTFDAVTEQGSDSSIDPSSLSHSLPLLEKFSHYADTVEQHLVREVSLRSTSFFAALTNLRDLQSESDQCLHRVNELRTLLKDVDEKCAKRGLEIVMKEQTLRRLQAIKEGLKTVRNAVDMTNVARTLASSGQWSEALEVIEDLKASWAPKQHEPTTAEALPEKASEPGIGNGDMPDRSLRPKQDVSTKTRVALPLSSLQAFAALPVHLRDLTIEITTSISSEVVNVLRLDLAERINSDRSQPQSDLHGAGPNQPLMDRLRPLLNGLVRTNGLQEVMKPWREAIMEEVRAVMNRRFSLLSEDGSGSKNQEKVATSSQQLQSMSHVDFMAAIRKTYNDLLRCVEGLQSQIDVLVRILSSDKLSVGTLDIPPLREEFGDILSSAVELSHTRAASILSMRVDQHTQLDLPEFLGLFNESWNFVVLCEVICKRMIVGLRGVVVSQAKSFLQNFHQRRISRSAKLVEDEQWAPTEVSSELQSAVGLVLDSAVRDPPELIIPATTEPDGETLNGSTSDSQNLASPPAVPAPVSLSTSSSSPPPPTPAPNGLSTSKHIRIEERTFFTVSATSAVLHLLMDYLKVIVNLTMLTPDTMSKVIEFLKAFNSRTCQVVLGAGAMRSAGLKNITARHLALASQSLSIMIALIPYVRETFRRHLNPKQAVMLVEFDKLKRDYQEHQNEIHAKLIAIMGDRLTNHIQSFQAIQWDVQKAGVNDYMELLIKETVTLHKVLSRYLATPVVEYVMTQVYAAINHRLSEEYNRMELPNEEVKERLLGDARYLHQKLSTLKNLGSTPSAMLETLISEKKVGGGKEEHRREDKTAGNVPVVPVPVPVPGSPPAVIGSKYNVMAANQRLKERLANSIKSVTSSTSILSASLMPAKEKALPQVVPSEAERGVMKPSADMKTGVEKGPGTETEITANGHGDGDGGVGLERENAIGGGMGAQPLPPETSR